MVWTKCAVGRVPGAGVPGAGRGGFYKFFKKKKKKEKLFGCHFVIRDGRGGELGVISHMFFTIKCWACCGCQERLNDIFKNHA